MCLPVRQHLLLWRDLGRLPISCVPADRRGRLSLLCGIPLDRKNHSNRLPLGTPPLGGGWEGFPDEGVCPYRLALSLIKETPFSIGEGRFLDTRRAFLRCKETPSSMRRERFFNFKILLPLFLSGVSIRVNDSIYSPSSFSERGGGEASLRKRRIPPIMLHALH